MNDIWLPSVQHVIVYFLQRAEKTYSFHSYISLHIKLFTFKWITKQLADIVKLSEALKKKKKSIPNCTVVLNDIYNMYMKTWGLLMDEKTVLHRIPIDCCELLQISPPRPLPLP